MKLQIKDIDGNVVEEKNIKVSDHDVLIMNAREKMTKQEMAHIHKSVGDCLENGGKVITVPDGVNITVLNIETK